MRLGTCKIDLSPPVFLYNDRFKAILLWWFFRFMFWCLIFFVLLALYDVFIFLVKFR